MSANTEPFFDLGEQFKLADAVVLRKFFPAEVMNPARLASVVMRAEADSVFVWILGSAAPTVAHADVMDFRWRFAQAQVDAQDAAQLGYARHVRLIGFGCRLHAAGARAAAFAARRLMPRPIFSSLSPRSLAIRWPRRPLSNAEIVACEQPARSASCT